MFFKNLTAFTLPADAALDLRGRLEEFLAEAPVRELGPLDSCSRGFIPPFGVEALTHDESGGTLIQLGGLDKIIPASAVGKAVRDKIAEIGEREGRRVGGKERRHIKDEILTRMLAQAFVQDYALAAYFDWQENLLLVDTSSESAATGLVENIRLAAGTFPVVPLYANVSTRVLLTDWVQGGKLPAGFALGDEAELVDPAEGGAKVKFTRQDLETDEVREHLQVGKQVTQLGLTFDNRVEFVLGADLVLRKVKFLDQVMDELVGADADTVVAEVASRFTLTVLEFRRLFQQLEKIFEFERPDAR